MVLFYTSKFFSFRADPPLLKQSVNFMQTPSAQAMGDTNKKDFFFDNPVRAALRQEIMAAITGGEPFMVFTGPSGSGKSALVYQLIAALPGNIKAVFISQTTDNCGRFEDVLSRVCGRIGLETSWDNQATAQEVLRILEEIGNSLTAKDVRLLLILDQAEQAFLAMLERVRRMLDTVNGGAVRMQLFLVGQKSLLADLDRLRLVHFEEIPECYFTMPLVEENDLPDFLRQWLRQAAPGLSEDAIPQREWQKICAEAAGRPGVLSTLLAERLTPSAGGKSANARIAASASGSGGHFQSAASDKPSTYVFKNIWKSLRQTLSALSPATLARRLGNALPAPPRLPKSRQSRPVSHKTPAIAKPAASNLAMRRLFSFSKALGHQAAAFWRKMGHQIWRLTRHLVHSLASLARGGAKMLAAILHGFGNGIAAIFYGLGKGIGSFSKLMARAFAAFGHGIAAIFYGIGRGVTGFAKFFVRTVGRIVTVVVAAFRAIIDACAGACVSACRSLTAGFKQLTHRLSQSLSRKAASRTANRQMAKQQEGESQAAGLATAVDDRLAKPTPPVNVLKKAVPALLVFCILAVAGTALWQGIFRSWPDKDRLAKPPPALTTTASQSAETFDGNKAVLPENESKVQRGEPEKAVVEKASSTSSTLRMPMASAPQKEVPIQAPVTGRLATSKVKPGPEPVPREPAQSRPAKPEPAPPLEIVRISADKVKKIVEPPPAPKPEPEPAEPEPTIQAAESVKPIYIARTKVVEKVKPSPVAAAVEPSQTRTVNGPEKTTPAEASKDGKVRPLAAQTSAQEEETPTPATSPEPPRQKEAPATGNDTYKAGLSAGQRWANGKNNGQYTVQILTTSTKEAQTLVSSLAAQHASRVRIVSTGANRVTLFYGDYPSITEARQARGTLPETLRQGNPYAISVDGAMGRLKAR